MNPQPVRRLLPAIAVMLIASPCFAQSPLELATAGASLALSRGVEAVFANPAHLGLTDPQSIECRLVSVGGGVHSNAFDLGDYRRYNGATFTADDKKAILAKVPGQGWSLSGEGSVSALALRLGSWGFAVQGLGTGRGRIDRDAVELALYGNAAHPAWSFNNSLAEGLGSAEASLSYGRTVAHAAGGPIAVGVTASYVRGLYLARSGDVSADLQTSDDGLTGQAFGDVITATGGNGLAFGLGAAWQPSTRWLLSLACENLYHNIRWTQRVERTLYRLTFNNLTVDNFDDSLWQSNETTEKLSSFSQGLPPRLRAGAAWDLGATRLGVEASVWTREQFGASTTPQLAAACEHELLRFLPVRAGFSVGGANDWAVGAGTGLHFGGFHWDFGLRVDRGVWVGTAPGVSAASAIDVTL
jgi:hypothetical protein